MWVSGVSVTRLVPATTIPGTTVRIDHTEHFRRNRTAAGNYWCIQRDGLLGVSANPRYRDSHGTRCATSKYPWYGAQERTNARHSRDCGRHICESGIDTLLIKPSLGRFNDRSLDIRDGHNSHSRGWVDGFFLARTKCGESGPADLASPRMNVAQIFLNQAIA